jgi:hypothetical protein
LDVALDKLHLDDGKDKDEGEQNVGDGGGISHFIVTEAL